MRYAFFIFMLAFAIVLIPFHSAAAQGASEGLLLFANNVLPSLFPFFVCAHFITLSGIISAGGKRSSSGYMLYWLITGICGTPSASLICESIYSSGVLSINRASVLCAILNQTGPVFIISTLSVGFLGNAGYALPFAISHYIPAAMLSALFIIINKSHKSCEPVCQAPKLKKKPDPNILKLFSESISDAVISVLRVGGTIVFFRVAYCVLSSLLAPLHISSDVFNTASGLFEMTNALQLITALPSRLNLSLCAFLLSFGGFCIFVQSKMLFPSLSAMPYLAAKLITGVFSGLTMWLIYPLFDFSAPTFSMYGTQLTETPNLQIRFAGIICGIIAVFLTLLNSLLISRLIRR